MAKHHHNCAQRGHSGYLALGSPQLQQLGFTVFPFLIFSAHTDDSRFLAQSIPAPWVLLALPRSVSAAAEAYLRLRYIRHHSSVSGTCDKYFLRHLTLDKSNHLTPLVSLKNVSFGPHKPCVVEKKIWIHYQWVSKNYDFRVLFSVLRQLKHNAFVSSDGKKFHCFLATDGDVGSVFSLFK